MASDVQSNSLEPAAGNWNAPPIDNQVPNFKMDLSDQEEDELDDLDDDEEHDDSAEEDEPQNEIRRESTALPWYADPVFNRYWKSYNLAMSWFNYHQQLVSRGRGRPQQQQQQQQQQRKLRTDFFSNMQPVSGNRGVGQGQGQPASQQHPPQQQQQQQTGKKKRTRKRKRRPNKKLTEEKKMRLRGKSGAASRSERSEDEPMFEMEITPEMKAFFAKSAEHRRQRAVREKEEESEDYIDLTEVTVNSKRITKAAPSERPGMRRTEQMKILYGSGAAMIHGMETALQLNFDRNFDIKTPKLWPHLPLNITFHN